MFCSVKFPGSNLLHIFMQFAMRAVEPTETAPPWYGTSRGNHTGNTTQITPPWESDSEITDNRHNDRDYWERGYESTQDSGTVPRPLQMHDWRGSHSTMTPAMDTGTDESVTDFDHHRAGYRHADHNRRRENGETAHFSDHQNHYSFYTDSSTTPTPDASIRLHGSKRIAKKRGKSDAVQNETVLIELNNRDHGKFGSDKYPSVEFSEFDAKEQQKSQKSSSTGREVKRSWPEHREKGERRIVAANYSAVEIHGFFGLIDDGSVGEGRMLIVHVPKWIRGYFLDIKQGDKLHVYHANGGKIGGALTVLSTGRHQYYAPGRRVTTCTVCVPEEQWAPFT